jgi:hypothetical protein
MMKTTPKIRPSQRIYQGNSTAWWMTYLQANPLQSAFAVTCTIGGMLLLIFFAQLHAMPELDLAGATSLLLAVAAVGLAFIFFLTVSAFAGGLMLQSYGAEAAPLREWCGALLLHMPLIFTGLAVWWIWQKDSPDFSCLNLFIPMFVCGGAGIYAWLFSLKRDWKTKATYALAYVWLSFLSLMIAGTAVLSFVAISTHRAGGDQQEFQLLLWVVWCIVCNFVMARLKPVRLDGLLVACSLSAFVLLFLSDNGMALPKAVVRSLGLGEMPVVLVVTEAGCQHLNQASGQKVCQVRPNEKSALVCPVLLRSRIGSPYFIGFSPLNPEGAWPANVVPTRTAAIAIPKTEVLSWSRIDAKRAEKQTTQQVASTHREEQGTASQIVTRWNTTAQGDWLARQCGLPD